MRDQPQSSGVNAKFPGSGNVRNCGVKNSVPVHNALVFCSAKLVFLIQAVRRMIQVLAEKCFVLLGEF